MIALVLVFASMAVIGCRAEGEIRDAGSVQLPQ